MNIRVKTFFTSSIAALASMQIGLANATECDRQVHHRYENVGGVQVFYREVGCRDSPTVLLLHGYGASSHMFRELMPKLAAKYHVVAPDLPGFGFTQVSVERNFIYTFDNLARVIDGFTRAKGLDKYAMYVFDYGAPVGWRLAVNNPDKITALITQNGNAYVEGLSEGWNEIRKTWDAPTLENREHLRKMYTLEMTKWQYTAGVKDQSKIAPETYFLAQAMIEHHGHDVQLDLILDYVQNIRQYPQVQGFFRLRRPPTLVIWGKNDPFFLPAGAEAFKRDNPDAEIVLLDTGHFAIETHGDEIANRVADFLDRYLPSPQR